MAPFDQELTRKPFCSGYRPESIKEPYIFTTSLLLFILSNQVQERDMNEKSQPPHSLRNPDKLETGARGLDHVREVYRKGHQGDHARPGRSKALRA